VTVTHPFLPYSGELIRVIGSRHPGGVHILKCVDSNGRTFNLYAEFTDFEKAEPPKPDGLPSCDLSYELLLELADAVDGIIKNVK
jgi:hypothetical protein